MRIVVTGGSGLVGRRVVRLLSGRHEIVNLDLRPGEAAGARYVRADILDADAVRRALEDADAVVHAAAIPGPSLGTTDDIYHANVRGTETVARAALAAGVGRFVHISSDAVLGIVFSKGKVRPRYFPVTEDHPLNPVEPYGRSKLLAEEVLRDLADERMTVVSLRPPWVWVPEEYWQYRTLTRSPEKWSDGLWAYVHGDDLALAVARAVELAVPSGFHAVFLAAPDNGTVFRTRRLLDMFYPEVPVRQGISGFGSLLSSRRADALLGFRPSLTWRRFLP